MFRALLTFILMANLLACPLRCASCDAGDVRVQEVPVATCSCCDQPSESSEDSDPVNTCQCPDCLCHGATLQAEVTVPNFDWQHQRISDDYAMAVNIAALSGSAVMPPQLDLRQIGDRGIGLRTVHALMAFQHWLI